MCINEMARRFGLDSGNLTRKLEELEGQGILKSQWTGAQRYYLLDRGEGVTLARHFCHSRGPNQALRKLKEITGFPVHDILLF